MAITAWSANVGDKFDLFRCERLCHSFGHENHADDLSVTQEWSAERGPVSSDPLRLVPGIFRISQHIGNVQNAGLQRASSGDAASIYRHLPSQKQFSDLQVDVRAKTEARCKAQELPVPLK